MAARGRKSRCEGGAVAATLRCVESPAHGRTACDRAVRSPWAASEVPVHELPSSTTMISVQTRQAVRLPPGSPTPRDPMTSASLWAGNTTLNHTAGVVDAERVDATVSAQVYSHRGLAVTRAHATSELIRISIRSSRVAEGDPP